MSAPGYDQLLIVQDHDTKLDQLRHRHAQHPLRDELAELQTKHRARQVDTDAVAAEQHDVDRQRKRIDDEVATVRARRADIERKLYDGSVTSTKDLLALQEESAHLLERQTSMEDDELELMEQLEEIDGRLSSERAALDELALAITAKEAELAVALEGVEAEIVTVTSERVEAAGGVPAELLATYDSLRSDMGGVAIARLVSNSCTGCHLALSAVEADRMKRLPDDAVVTCDSCGRILVR